MPKLQVKNIFLVDDDPQHNEMLREYLRQHYKVNIYPFTSGEEAVKRISELRPAYVILDYYLDRDDKNAKNGLDILKMIKKEYPDTYIVMLSGQDKIDVAVDTMKFGAYDYVVKNPSGFIRVDTIMRNIRENMRLRFYARAYRFATFFLAGFIVVIIITAIVLRMLGISTDNVGW
ncbi:MAG: response regulator [Chitinophagales bacterium]